MLRLTAALFGALRLIGSTVGFGGRLIADRQTTQNSQRRLAAPRNQDRSRLSARVSQSENSGRTLGGQQGGNRVGGDFPAEPLGDAFVVKAGSVVLCLSVCSEVLKTRPSVH